MNFRKEIVIVFCGGGGKILVSRVFGDCAEMRFGFVDEWWHGLMAKASYTKIPKRNFQIKRGGERKI